MMDSVSSTGHWGVRSIYILSRESCEDTLVIDRSCCNPRGRSSVARHPDLLQTVVRLPRMLTVGVAERSSASCR